MVAGRRAPPERDEDVTAFSPSLQRLCECAPAVAAALVDGEGETVDYAGMLSPYDVKVAAAEWQLVLGAASRCHAQAFAGTYEVLIRCQRRCYALYGIGEGYALILQLPDGCIRVSPRALGESVRAICEEAGLELPTKLLPDQWLSVDIKEESGESRRPSSILYAGAWRSLEVIGRYEGPDLLPRERAYRVRLDNGMETMLVRERLGRWFSDHPPPDAPIGGR